jgi:hypothetical protein
MNEKVEHGHDSEASPVTELENGAGPEGVENVLPHQSQHPHFGANKVYSNNNDADDMPTSKKAGTYDKIELTEEMCYDELGYSFPEWRKW